MFWGVRCEPCKLINIKGQNSCAAAWQIPHQLFIVAVKPETLSIYSHVAHSSPGSCSLSPPLHFKQCKNIFSPCNHQTTLVCGAFLILSKKLWFFFFYLYKKNMSTDTFPLTCFILNHCHANIWAAVSGFMVEDRKRLTSRVTLPHMWPRRMS